MALQTILAGHRVLLASCIIKGVTKIMRASSGTGALLGKIYFGLIHVSYDFLAFLMFVACLYLRVITETGQTLKSFIFFLSINYIFLKLFNVRPDYTFSFLQCISCYFVTPFCIMK